jgi:hypothetical protein
MNVRAFSLALALAAPLALGQAEGADRKAPGQAKPKPQEAQPPAKEFVSFGSLKAPDLDTARTQALNWLKGAGKADAQAMKEFEALWNTKEDVPLLSRVAGTLRLGDVEAAKLLDQAADASVAAPVEVPALLKDAKRPAFFRANLGLAYARTLSGRRVFEEALDVLRQVKPDQVVDPGAYFFHRALAEHALLLKDQALHSITAVIEDVSDAPDRYKMVSILMLYDMRSWKDKDLGWISRKMGNIERRLELARGGPQTQKMQKEVVARLDELIKQLENQNNGSGSGNGGGCPSSGGGSGSSPGNTNNPSSPMKDSNIATNGGPGNVDQKRLKGLAEQWGTLPEKERAKAMADLTRGMPAEYRDVIERYFKDLAKSSTGR